jgi:hypothetical protein
MKETTKVWLDRLLRRFGVPDSDFNPHKDRSRTPDPEATLEDIIGIEAPPLQRRRRRYPGGTAWRGPA